MRDVRPTIRVVSVTFALLAAGLLPDPARAQLSPACDLGCPQYESCGMADTACHARNAARTAEVTQCQAAQNACMAKYTLFGGYLDQMGAGVPLYSLPSFLVETMDPHFPGISVAQWQFGYSNRQPADNATTDCDRTYFNDQSMVDALRDGEIAYVPGATNQIGWLAHEIRHYEQCVEVGGRDFFSELWWGDLSETDLTSMNMEEIHDEMAMEQDAMTLADQIVYQLLECCVHPASGELIPPLEVVSRTPASLSKLSGESIEIGVEVEGGAEPITYEWWWQCPMHICFNSTRWSSAGPTDDRIDFTASQHGVHTVWLRIRQAEGAVTTLPVTELTWHVTVSPPPEPMQTMPLAENRFGSRGTCDLEARFIAPRQRVLSSRSVVDWRVRIRNVGDGGCEGNRVSLERSAGKSRSRAATLVGGRRGARAIPKLGPGDDTVLEFRESARGRGGGAHTYSLRYADRIDDADARNHAPVVTVTFR